MCAANIPLSVSPTHESERRRRLSLPTARPLHQLHPGRSRSLVRYHDRLHDYFLLGHLSLWWKCCSVGRPARHLMPGAMGSFRKRRWNSALPVVDVTSLKVRFAPDSSMGKIDSNL